ncbi:MAG: hypothetical protein ACLP2P_08215 [Desulfobaccales bacterium]
MTNTTTTKPTIIHSMQSVLSLIKATGSLIRKRLWQSPGHG